MADRHKTAQFFIDAFGYKIQTEFDIKFEDGSTAKCIALEPPEKTHSEIEFRSIFYSYKPDNDPKYITEEHHLAPELFISDGTPDSIVGQWVAKYGSGVHHFAYQVPSVKKIMEEWKEKGFAEFTTEDVLKCPGITQVFTKPSELTGVIYEFIERGRHGFCQENVARLIFSTKNL